MSDKSQIGFIIAQEPGSPLDALTIDPQHGPCDICKKTVSISAIGLQFAREMARQVLCVDCATSRLGAPLTPRDGLCETPSVAR